MKLNRIPTPQEARLLELLIKKSPFVLPKNWEKGLLVRPMDDGEMGSLHLFPKGVINKKRISGELVSEFQFTDQDGVRVIASLYVDEDGNLFELDIWKTDFSKLIKLPDI